MTFLEGKLRGNEDLIDSALTVGWLVSHLMTAGGSSLVKRKETWMLIVDTLATALMYSM